MNLERLRLLFNGPLKNANRDISTPLADEYINRGYKELFSSHRWAARKRTGSVTLFPNYTTGTCSVTKFDGTNSGAAKTVTFSGATLSDSMLGRYFKAQDSSKWHKIVFISGSTAYLDSEIVDVNSASGLTFQIWKRFYYLKSDVEEVLDFGRWNNTGANYDPDILGKHADISETGTPYSYEEMGIDPYDDKTYTTGTISIPVDSNVVTGVGTSWLSAGFDTGDIMEIANDYYYIKRVDSDTQIILFNYSISGVTAGTGYTLRKDNPYGFEFYNPTDSYDVMPYYYYCKAYSLVHPTKDHILLSDKYVQAIISRAHYWALRDAGDDRANTALNVYISERTGLMERSKIVNARSTQFAPYIHPRQAGRG